MSQRQHPAALVLLLGAGLLALPFVAAPIAEACGTFYHRETIAPERRPSLAREKVVIIHDAARMQQHFIREVAFRQADQPFGFVVPTPTRPEVGKVEKNPFTRLRERFRFADEPKQAAGIGSGHGSSGGGRGGGSEPVEVLAVEKVGSFTAFVLAASDTAALAGWLQDNQLTSRSETNQWLEHYVRMGFYYVALRYDPPANAKPKASAPIAAETIRISFATPVAYYPYHEPQRDRFDPSPRLLELWYIGADPVVPVTYAQGHRYPSHWVKPLMPGKAYPDEREAVEATLLDELEQLLPDGELVVQTFQDQKIIRENGDILFAFEQPKQLTPEQLAALEPLLGVLDPGLIEERR